jgi:hypothetical protein
MRRECEICGEKFEVNKEVIMGKGNKRTEIYFSEEGVYFEDGKVWFCNSCFNEMTKEVFNKFKGKQYV